MASTVPSYADMTLIELVREVENKQKVIDHLNKLLAERAYVGRDSERLDWLEMMQVEVRQPLVHGSAHLFHAGPEQGDGEDTPSDIRKEIDYQQHGGEKPRRISRDAVKK